MASRASIEVSGQTTDGKLVVRGLLWFYETHGLPLTVIFHCCEKKQWVPDWPALWAEALRAGWAEHTILSRLDEAVTDVWGPATRDAVLAGLKEHCGVAQR